MSSSTSNPSSMTSSILFHKTLADIVKGIRNYKNNPTEFISQSIIECKNELNTTDFYLKAEAIRKLTYLQMLGYNINWASFFIVEVMSQSRFEQKRIGYLAANQSFTDTTDVILLTTNLLKKEFTSQNPSNLSYDIGLALNCLSNIATRDLSRDCISDIVHLLQHQKPYIRKKAIICLYKLYLKYPQGLRLTFDNLREKLDDFDTSVVSCAVNVICELARKNPRNYLSMAPKFFQLLTTSSNNWMLIKVVKLLGSLVKEEPRLARKLLEPLATIIQNTSAKSLQYECISTITLALPYTKRDDGSDAKNLPNILSLCVTQLQGLVKDEDPNLKYLGLVGFIQLMASHPKIVMEQRDLVLNCLNDEDVTIRSKALELLSGIVTKKSLVDFVHHLLRHLRQADGSYRDNIISTILDMGGLEKFSLVTDFIWYVSVLQRLACVQGGGATAAGLFESNKLHHGKRVAEQLMEITLRVKNVRPFAVECMVTMLLDGGKLILGHAKDTVAEVMMAAAWICGEYSDVLTRIMLDLKSEDESDEEDEEEEEEDQGYWIEGPEGDEIRSKWRGKPVVVMTIACLLHPRSTNLPARVQCAFIHAALKILIRSCDGRCSQEHLSQILALLRTRLPVYLQSVHLEVQERASTLRYLLAETGILAVNAGLTNTKSNQMTSQSQSQSQGDENGDLLTFKDLDPVDGDDIELTQIRVLSVDFAGASQAISAYSYLRAIVNEEFYGVHPKAQRKVQVPEGLDLSQPFNKKAVDDLLSEETKQQEFNISSVCFIKTTFSSSSSYSDSNKQDSHLKSSYNSSDSKEDKNKSKDFYSESGQQSQRRYDFTSTNNSETDRNTTDQTFYLNRNKVNEREEEGEETTHFTDGLQPIDSQTHADSRRKKKKTKKSSRKNGKKNRETEYADIAPLGLEDDDEDEDGNEKGVFRNNSGMDHDDDYEDLEKIDLTKPLRPDESLPVLRHRETPAAVAPVVSSKRQKDANKWGGEEAEGGEVEEGGVVKREKKKKHKEKKKEKKTKIVEGMKTNDGIGDLLEMNFEPQPSSSSSSSSSLPLSASAAPALITTSQQTIYPSLSTLSSLPLVSQSLESTNKGSSKSSSSKSKSKSKSKTLWLPFCQHSGQFEILYSIENLLFNGRDIGNLSVTFKIINLMKTSSISLELSLTSTSSGSYRLPPHNKITLVSSLTANSEEKLSTSFDVAPTINPLNSNNLIECNLHFTSTATSSSSSISEGNQSFLGIISLPLPLFFQPHVINEQEFQSLLSSSSSSSSSSSMKTFQTKYKINSSSSSSSSSDLDEKHGNKLLKMLVRYLHGHPIESLEGKSIACCSSFHLKDLSNKSELGRDYLICSLLKYQPSGGGAVVVELKCLGIDGNVAQQIGNEIVRALSRISF